MRSSPKRSVFSSDGLISKLKANFGTGVKISEIVQGLETQIQRLKDAQLITSSGGRLKPTMAFFTQTVERIRKIGRGEE